MARVLVTKAVEAAHAFIVRAATTGAFGPPPDVVLSGINIGPNTGHAALHSGTVGAALTGSTTGARAAAFSIGVGNPIHGETGTDVAVLADGAASVTALHAVCEAADVDVEGMLEALTRIAN